MSTSQTAPKTVWSSEDGDLRKKVTVIFKMTVTWDADEASILRGRYKKEQTQ